ncbi:MAG: hypothetical protein LBH35_10295 [Treponema sp.]|jgi:hypothetical protein|nr:hypothetical protein [Treponema sp.]
MEKTPEKSGGNPVLSACAAILCKEIDLLEKIPALQILVRDAVINREWADYEAYLEAIGGIGEDFELLETERNRLFAEAAPGEDLDEKERFYALSVRLPERERNELTALYRRLKIQALQIRLTNDNLMDYIRETKNAISGMLESAYPDRKGKIYSRNGVEREADMKSVVLNRHF